MPQHIAIIMDGNGRWAKARGLPREHGHRKGVENVKAIVSTARELDLRFLTLYAFSVENWKRPKTEVAALMRLLDTFLTEQSKDLIEKQIRLRVIGRLDALPFPIARRLRKMLKATASFERWNLTLALSYGARTELIDAVQAYSKAVLNGTESPDKLDWPTFAKFLYTADMPDPDLVIRTSGEQRISNFLLMQSAYAEYFFAPQCWPDFDPDAFRAAISQYRQRERRFGLTSEQISNHAITQS